MDLYKPHAIKLASFQLSELSWCDINYIIIYQKIGFISTWYYQWYLGCFILHFVRSADVCWSCFRPCVQPKEPSYSSRWRRSAWHPSLHPTRPRCYHPPVERKQVEKYVWHVHLYIPYISFPKSKSPTRIPDKSKNKFEKHLQDPNKDVSFDMG